MSTAILTPLREITQADIDCVVAAAADKAAQALTEYEQACRDTGISIENKAAGESGKLLSGGGWDRVRAQWVRVQRAERSARQTADAAKHRKPRKAAIRIAVIDAYSIKDQLKTRGYRFDRDGYWVDFLGVQTSAAWVRTVEPAVIDDEIAALRNMGATIEIDSTLNIQLKPENL